MCRYQGGKQRIAKEICDVIQKQILDDPYYQHHTYFEPMVGMCGIMKFISHPNKKIACDIHPDVIAMWKQLQSGKWIPPTSSSKQEFEYWKHYVDDNEINDTNHHNTENKNKNNKINNGHPNRAFFGFGCSFGAHFFAGYVDKDPRQIHAKDPALIAHNKLIKTIPLIKDVEFLDACSYDQHKTPQHCIIYLDPPYQNTRKYSGIPAFDHSKFWKLINEWADPKNNNVVIVSELTGPPQEIYQDGWSEIWSKPFTRATAHPKKGIIDPTHKYTVEKLFCKGLKQKQNTNNNNINF